MPNTATWRMADRLTGGTLADTIRGYRTAGLSPDQIAARLYADHGVEVTGRTLRRWLPELIDVDAEPLDAA